jgi:HlyD family secretion protein
VPEFLHHKANYTGALKRNLSSQKAICVTIRAANSWCKKDRLMRKWVIGLIIVVLLGVAGYFGWQRIRQNSSQALSDYQTVVLDRGDLTAYVGTTGTVRANQTAALTWQINGRIGTIQVSIDDQVTAEQPLAELSKDSLPQTVILAEADLINARRSLDTLLNSEVAKAQAQLALVQAQDALEQAQNKRESKEYQRASDATLDSARASYILAQDAVDNAEQLYDQFDSFPEANVNRASALSNLAAAIQQRDRALAQLNWLLGTPDALEISQADASLEVAQANLEDARREWERLKEGPDPEDVRAAEVRIVAIQNTLDSARLKAPFNGTVTEVYGKVGDLVNPGTLAFRIDDLSHLIVDVKVPEVDINRVQLGQIARISFDAIQSRDYTGEVVEVARVGSVSASGGVDFTVSIELLDADELVRPGMTAAVNIVVNQLSDVLLVPNRAVRLRNNQRVVFVLRNDTLTQIEIQLGAVSDTYSEVIAGDLQVGDLIVLNPPAEEINGPPSFVR